MHTFLVPPGFTAASWNGSPTTLAKNAGVSMSPTPNGSLVVGYFNTSTQNSAGRLSVTSGGSLPQIYDVPALQKMMNLLINNWSGNNLNLTNLSIVAVGIFVQAFGPGIPNGVKPVNLPIGTQIQLPVFQAAQGVTLPNSMMLSLTSNPGYLSVIAVIGGPLDSTGNNAYVIALNAPGDSGPGTGLAPPPGYYATTSGNTYQLLFNWSASVIYVANMSPQAPAPVSVLLQSL